MKSRYLRLIVFWFGSQVKSQPKDMFTSKLTAINAASLTDVVFAGIKTAALVSMFSGRIALRVNGIPKQKLVCM